MGYLVDTNVLSATAPTKVRAATFADWLNQNSDRLYLTTITVAEIEDGIAKARREGATRKAVRLAEWLDAVLHLYDARVLPFDFAAARVAGRLWDRARSRGHAPGFADVAIAAIAEANGLIVLTRNTKDFAPMDAHTLNPLGVLPN